MCAYVRAGAGTGFTRHNASRVIDGFWMMGTLHNLFGPDAATDDELMELRILAWRQQGVAVIHVDDIRSPSLRMAIGLEATRLYGPRNEKLGRHK